ncbi:MULTISPECIES: DNA cytosine methyltransferase [unclassified Rhizobacter]|uniref:DNA cytosine methyltransferase n=1 Tax=unclassified Rhizobacter TaxID=2640088 RepID=UPI0009EC2F8D|nr:MULTISPECIES: DNA cytosine methyltransferase [unclassified Rhizobacter]
MSSSKKINVIDLFAGAGGLSVGASQAGASVAASLEFNAIACDTLRANPSYHGSVIEGDVCAYTGQDLRKIGGLKKSDPLVVVGGPPCQPFSKAAYWTEDGQDAAYRRARAEGKDVEKPAAPTKVKDDDRRDLVREFWRVVRESNADGFVFENVPSIRHPRNRPIYDGLVRSARDAGYEVTEVVANAAEYGVAQARERVLVLGSKKRKPNRPEQTHALDAQNLLLPPAVTAGEALDGLGLKKYFEPEEVVTGRWARHLEEVPPGWNYKAHTSWANHPNPTFVTETRFWNFLLKLSKDRPSWTLAASPGPWTGPFHWKNRRLRTPEMAALQGFPREYVIAGSRRERVRQMGNAVPVPLAKLMVGAVLESLE